jgi:hypothetical protein
MQIEVKFSSLKTTKPHEYVVRFFFGGLITVLTGLIAKHYGPGVAGLFLAFPAIFPASATLIEKHEKQTKRKVGMDGTNRGRAAASVDAAGTAISCLGLPLFAVIIWRWLPGHNGAVVLTVAGLAWLVAAVCFWMLRKLVG